MQVASFVCLSVEQDTTIERLAKLLSLLAPRGAIGEQSLVIEMHHPHHYRLPVRTAMPIERAIAEIYTCDGSGSLLSEQFC